MSDAAEAPSAIRTAKGEGIESKPSKTELMQKSQAQSKKSKM